MHDIDPEEALRWLKDRPHADINTVTGCFAGGWPAVVAVLHPMKLDAPLRPGDEEWDGMPRLRWREAFDEAGLAGRQPFPPGGWDWVPSELRGHAVHGPWEGQLDDDVYRRLGVLLREHTLGGGAAPATYYWALLACGHAADDGVALSGTLDEFDLGLRRPGFLSPSNIWPSDHSWLFGTGIDDLFTLVAGSVELIEAIDAEPMMDTARMEWRDGAVHGV